MISQNARLTLEMVAEWHGVTDLRAAVGRAPYTTGLDEDGTVSYVLRFQTDCVPCWARTKAQLLGWLAEGFTLYLSDTGTGEGVLWAPSDNMPGRIKGAKV
jgi:hypothetical protein